MTASDGLVPDPGTAALPGASIELRSDNCAGATPEVMAALVEANRGSALGYGGDDWSRRLQQRAREVFEHDGARVFPVVSGTAANALALSAMTPPWGAVLCHDTAHITINEANATSLFSGGAALIGVGGAGSLIDPDRLRDTLERTGWGDPHRSQPVVVSVTQPTDLGAVYPVEHLRRLAAIGGERGLRMHLDGARLANALSSTGTSPADGTWRAGVSVLTLGATKNGTLSTDAIVSFDADVSAELDWRLKRSGHVASKLRFQSAQLLAYLADDRWLHTAGHANAMLRRLVTGLSALGIEPTVVPQANLAFYDVDLELADRWEAAGLAFYRIDGRLIRFVTSFATTEAEIDDALDRMRACR